MTKRFCLIPFDESLISDEYINWLNDPEVCKGNSHGVYPYTKKDAEDYLCGVKERRDLIFAILDKKNDLHIGNVSLQSMSLHNRSAEIAILIGDKNYWGKGCGKEVCSKMLEYAFETLGLNRIFLGTFEGNEAMKRVALSIGMVKEGVERQAVNKFGTYLNIIKFAILREEYNQQNDI